jgi:hypothetical protein
VRDDIDEQIDRALRGGEWEPPEYFAHAVAAHAVRLMVRRPVARATHSRLFVSAVVSGVSIAAAATIGSLVAFTPAGELSDGATAAIQSYIAFSAQMSAELAANPLPWLWTLAAIWIALAVWLASRVRGFPQLT